MRLVYITILFILLSACSGDSETPTTPPPPVPAVPKSATLIFPDNNTECNEGVVINGNETQTSVTFRWSASENTDSYELNLRNLNNNNISKISSITNEVAVNVGKGTPYEWFVISKNTTTTTATSTKFKFYNQGLGVQNYAPFPAEVISPARGSTVPNNTTIILKWNASDIDNDIVNYDVLFDIANPPSTSLGTVTQKEITASIETGQIYFWRVITRDSNENTSNSEIFEFQVQ